VIEYPIFCLWASSATEATKETKFGGLGEEDDARTCEYTHSAEKARDTTLDDENASQHNFIMTCVVVKALGK